MEPSLGTQARPLRVAVVGSGPSGFYAVAALFKQEDLVVEVDVFDRLPTPFGLVRGGVAPDHPKIKSVTRVYDKTASHDGFRFFGNVQIGRDLSVEELSALYDQVVFAHGNESDRKMGIPGEELAGVHSATELVGWYNGHPDFQHLSFDLATAKRIAVVGNGNVAMDVTRILARDPDELAATDITATALEALRQSSIEEIFLLGRRGPAQAAFSPKEIKEVGSLSRADLVVDQSEVQLDEVSRQWLDKEAPPSAKKNVEYLTERSTTPLGHKPRRIVCRFLVSPQRLSGSDGKLTTLELIKNELYADDQGTPRPRPTEVTEILPVDLLFKAVGYRGLPFPGLPFDERRGIVPNDQGRITSPETGQILPRLYVVGWAKRGPTGLIGTNGPDSQATVACMIEDLSGLRDGEPPAARSAEAVVELLRDRDIDFVSFEDWQRLDADEVSRGKATGKPREKYTDIASMMAAVQRLRTGAAVSEVP